MHEEESLEKKVEAMEKMLSRVVQSTEIFHNKNFLYFLQSLVDKEQGNLRLVP